jgi:hypothetical protein
MSDVTRLLDAAAAGGRHAAAELLPEALDLLLRIDADGTRTVGRFVGRTFQAAE